MWVDVVVCVGRYDHVRVDIVPITHLCVSSILTFRCFYSVGLGSIPAVLVAEILPYQVRGRGLSLASMVNWISNYIVTSSFLDWLHRFGPTAVYGMYTAVALCAILFTQQFVWETKGKSLEDLEEELNEQVLDEAPDV